MDTLSSSVSTLQVPTLHSNTSSRTLTHFKTAAASYSSSNLLDTKRNNTSISKYKATPNLFTPTFSCSLLPPTSPLNSSSLSPSPTLHQKPATGYAVALLDIAQHNNSVDLVGKDVDRFLKLIRNKRLQGLLNGELLGEREKGQVVKDLAEKGRFNRHLVCLVSMLAGKNKIGIVKEVLEEFERVYDAMLGTEVVLISSVKRMKEDQMFRIANRVQRLTGALKVKVRNLVQENSLSFAHI